MLVPTPISEVSSRPVATVAPERSVRAAATAIADAGASGVIVCEGDDPVGLVSATDVAAVLADGRDPDATTVRDIMTAPIPTISPSAPIETAAERMRDAGVDRLAIVDDGALVGVATTSAVSDYLPHLLSGPREAPGEARSTPTSPRLDTAYEREDWTFEYVGDESAIDVGDRVAFTKTLSASDVEAFAEASGDTNRLHLDADYGAETRFGRRIVHGTLVAGVISAALARLPGLIIYLSQQVSYLGPVDLDQRVTAEAEVVEAIGEHRFRLATTVSTSGETVVEGEAVVIADPIPAGA